MSQPLKVEPDLEFIRRLKETGGETLKKCYQCATCSVVCERSPQDNPFPRKEMIWAQWGLRERLMADPDVWLCYQCSDCSIHCPRGAKPGDLLAAVRSSVIDKYAIPRFLARAAASPKGLPLLLLIAAFIVFFLVWWTGQRSGAEHWGLNAPVPPLTQEAIEKGTLSREGGYFGNFLEHGPVEMIFIGGNILVFFLVAISLTRFWRDMKKAYGRPDGPSFVASVILALKEVLPHTGFKDCTTTRYRHFAHLLVFYGFFGAMATAGLAVLDMIVLGHQPPIPFFNPIKILGNLSFLALVIGSLIMIFRRLAEKRENVGSGGYTDWIFLVSLFLVALTGGCVQLCRNLDVPPVAYAFYGIHMVFVFFLLWYAPYSKFAHLFYRSLAIVFANSIGRSKAKPGA